MSYRRYGISLVIAGAIVFCGAYVSTLDPERGSISAQSGNSTVMCSGKLDWRTDEYFPEDLALNIISSRPYRTSSGGCDREYGEPYFVDEDERRHRAHPTFFFDAYDFVVSPGSSGTWTFSIPYVSPGPLPVRFPFMASLILYHNGADPYDYPFDESVGKYCDNIRAMTHGEPSGDVIEISAPLTAGLYTLVVTIDEGTGTERYDAYTYDYVYDLTVSFPPGEAFQCHPRNGEIPTTCEQRAISSAFQYVGGSSCSIGYYYYHAYDFVVTTPSLWTFSTCESSSNVDTVLSVWDNWWAADCPCDVAAGLVASNDDACGAGSRLTHFFQAPGCYTLIVRSYQLSHKISYRLSVWESTGTQWNPAIHCTPMCAPEEIIECDGSLMTRSNPEQTDDIHVEAESKALGAGDSVDVTMAQDRGAVRSTVLTKSAKAPLSLQQSPPTCVRLVVPPPLTSEMERCQTTYLSGISAIECVGNNKVASGRVLFCLPHDAGYVRIVVTDNSTIPRWSDRVRVEGGQVSISWSTGVVPWTPLHVEVESEGPRINCITIASHCVGTSCPVWTTCNGINTPPTPTSPGFVVVGPTSTPPTTSGVPVIPIENPCTSSFTTCDPARFMTIRMRWRMRVAEVGEHPVPRMRFNIGNGEDMTGTAYQVLEVGNTSGDGFASVCVDKALIRRNENNDFVINGGLWATDASSALSGPQDDPSGWQSFSNYVSDDASNGMPDKALTYFTAFVAIVPEECHAGTGLLNLFVDSDANVGLAFYISTEIAEYQKRHWGVRDSSLEVKSYPTGIQFPCAAGLCPEPKSYTHQVGNDHFIRMYRDWAKYGDNISHEFAHVMLHHELPGLEAWQHEAFAYFHAADKSRYTGYRLEDLNFFEPPVAEEIQGSPQLTALIGQPFGNQGTDLQLQVAAYLWDLADDDSGDGEPLEACGTDIARYGYDGVRNALRQNGYLNDIAAYLIQHESDPLIRRSVKQIATFHHIVGPAVYPDACEPPQGECGEGCGGGAP